jgi:hypothetical protein
MKDRRRRGRVPLSSNLWIAEEGLEVPDYTVGPSGACGANKWLVIEIPFKLVKTG